MTISIVLWRLPYFMCLPVVLYMLSGCSTMIVWSSSPEWEYETVAIANGKELTAESPAQLKDRTLPEMRLMYADAKLIKEGANFPPAPSGCIIMKNLDDSLRLLSGLESFLRTPSSSTVCSIKAVVNKSNFMQERGFRKYGLRLGLAFKTEDDGSLENKILQNRDGTWVPLLHGRPAQGTVKRHSSRDATFEKLYTPLDLFIIAGNDIGLSYFLVGGPSGGGPSGMTELTFADDCAMPGNISLLSNNNAPFTIQFVEATEINKYKYSVPARILLTPISVAADIVTFPLQLILLATAEHWMPR